MTKGWTTTKLIAIGSLAVLQIIGVLAGATLNTISGMGIGGIINGFVFCITFVLCSLTIKKFGAAVLMGLLAGILAIPLPILLAPGFLPKVFILFAMGLTVDCLLLLPTSNKKFLTIMTGGLVNLVNLLVSVSLAIIFLIPGLANYLKLTWSLPALVGTFVQGLFSGWFSWLIYQKIKNAAVVKRIQG